MSIVVGVRTIVMVRVIRRSVGVIVAVRQEMHVRPLDRGRSIRCREMPMRARHRPQERLEEHEHDGD